VYWVFVAELEAALSQLMDVHFALIYCDALADFDLVLVIVAVVASWDFLFCCVSVTKVDLNVAMMLEDTEVESKIIFKKNYQLSRIFYKKQLISPLLKQ
jgi:hypothetical protein